MGGVGQLTLARALQRPADVAVRIRSATPAQLPVLLERLAQADASEVQADQRAFALALQQEAEALSHATSLEALETAKTHLLDLLQPVATSATGPGLIRFATTGEVTAKLEETLATEAAARDYRPETLYVSQGRELPIRPGISKVSHLQTSPIPRVLFVSLFPIGSNGSGTYTRAMAEYLISQGGDARVLFPGHQFLNHGFPAVQYLMPFTPPSGESLPGAARANIPVLHSNPASPNGIRFADLTPLQLSAYSEGLADAVVEAARDMSADVLVVNHAWVGAEAARRTGLPYVVVCHGTCGTSMEEALRPDSNYPENLPDLVLPGVRRANRLVAVTPEVEHHVARIYETSPDQIDVIPHGFDNQIFYPRPGLSREAVLDKFEISTVGMTHLVTFAGRMVEYRGLHVLFKTIPDILRTMPGVHFVIAGDGAERARYERMAIALGISDNVHFIGHLSDRNGLAELHAVADLNVNPTFTESFGIGTLEAAGVGTPVVASNVGGLQFLVTPDIGVLVPPGDSQALGHAILDALATDLKGRIGATAAEHVHRNYLWTTAGGRLMGVLRDVLSDTQ